MIVAITMVKDEQDVIYHTLKNLIDGGVDNIIVADNMSSDNTTAEVIRAAADFGSIMLVEDDDPAYTQSEKMTALAHKAYEMFKADFILPFDADEIWTAEYGLAKVINSCPPQINIIACDLYNYFRTGKDIDSANPFVSMQHRQAEAGALKKVICRYKPDLVIEQGNHGAHYKNRRDNRIMLQQEITLRHFPYRSFEQFKRKVINGAKAYEAAGDRVSPDAGTHWRDYYKLYMNGGDAALSEVYNTWFYFQDAQGLVYDPVFT